MKYAHENGCPGSSEYVHLLRKIGNVLVETNDAPHTNPTPMPPASANKPLPQIDRVPTATNVPSFIERYKVDMLYTQEVKERFGLNDLDRAENRRLASRVTSARAAARPYEPLFETLQFLIEGKQLSTDTIQKNFAGR